MSLMSGVIPSLHNGVSQQSPLVRAPEQCEALENGWCSLAVGTGKRAPTETVAKLMDAAPASGFIHEINRDATERYVVVVSEGVIRVFDLDGVEQSVSATNGWGYIADAAPSDLTMATVADYTFVVNRKKVPQMGAVGDDLLPPPVDLSTIPTVTPNRNRTGNLLLDAILDKLAGQRAAAAPNPSTVMNGVVQTFEKLPDTAPQGALYEVQGTTTTKFISYYVRRNGGVWDETVKNGLRNTILPETMPHALVRQADGTFIFAPFAWQPRRVGDEATNPPPAFIGRTIQKVLIYQNRLVFLTDESAVMSVSGEFDNFWRTTVLDYIDSDPITVAATSTKVSMLYDAVPFNDGIMLTSDQTQFSMSNGESGLSATSIAIRPVTNYEVNTRAGMVAVGTEVYFTSERNGSTVVREYTRDPDSDATTAADVTAHIPSYIPAGAHKLISASDLNALFVLTEAEPAKAFVYQFYWLSASEKAQSSWHTWEFGEGAELLSGAYLGGFLYLILKRPDGLFLERINLQADAKAPGCSHQVHLDRRCSVTGSVAAGSTVFEVPYVPDHDRFRLVRTDQFGKPLSLIDPSTYEWATSNTVVVPGFENAGPVIGGEAYTFRYRFSPQYLRRSDGTAVTTGRTQLRTFTVNYRDTGYFKTSVAPYGTDPQVEVVLPAKIAEFTGKVLGANDLIINKPSFHTGSYSFQVYGEASVAAIELLNDSHVASTFVSAEWEAFFWSRARV